MRRPTARRFLACALALACPSAAAATWTLESAQARVLTSAHLDELGDAAARAARAEGAATLPRDNPFLGYQREQSFGAGGTGTAEDYLWVGQTFDLSFRRGLYEEAGERRAEAAHYRVADRRRELLASVALRYASALRQEHRVRVQRTWLSRLRDLADTVRAREAAGDASRYDVLRIEREVALAEQRLDESAVELQGARAELAAWLGDDARTMALTGDLAPPAPTTSEVPRPPSALALDLEAKALSLEEDAAGRWFVPPVTLTGGGKTVFAPDVAELGYLVTASVPLPVLERNKAREAQLAAARQVTAREADLRAREVERRAAAYAAEWSRALEALAAHGQRSAARSAELITTARAAWAGGELSLLALLEAERTALDDDITTSELALRARLAQIQHASLASEVAP